MSKCRRYVLTLTPLVAIVLFVGSKTYFERSATARNSKVPSRQPDHIAFILRVVPELCTDEGQPFRLDEYVSYVDRANESILSAFEWIVTAPSISDLEREMVWGSLQYCHRDFRSLTPLAIEHVNRSDRKHGGIQFLGHHGTPEAIPTLETLMYGEDSSLCYSAVRSIASLDPGRACRIIEKWDASDAFADYPQLKNTVINLKVELILNGPQK